MKIDLNFHPGNKPNTWTSVGTRIEIVEKNVVKTSQVRSWPPRSWPPNAGDGLTIFSDDAHHALEYYELYDAGFSFFSAAILPLNMRGAQVVIDDDAISVNLQKHYLDRLAKSDLDTINAAAKTLGENVSKICQDKYLRYEFDHGNGMGFRHFGTKYDTGT